ncbi:MAG: PAS domain-containing sensor histidine kinase, partial [Acidobacteria bacterium]
MPNGGTLTLRTRQGADKSTVAIEVEDTGTGITPENMHRLFTPFFTTKPVGKGTGLGLAIVYGIIKMHRGQIIVQSQVGWVTSFSLNLPVRPPRLKTPVAPQGLIEAEKHDATVIG